MGTKQSKPTTSEITIGIYRICFGLLMCFSMIRFMYKGWIATCYLSNDFHFTYQYFDWIAPLNSAVAMYTIVIATAMLALLIALGIWYRFATIGFFLCFTYLELIEKSWYLNHYYFVSIVAFLLCFIPADAALSLGKKTAKPVNNLYANVLRFQISIVYFFAGLAKLQTDWLVDAQPLKIWLKSKTDVPLIGRFMAYEETAYLFSYGGAIYDLCIPFLLCYAITRPFAFIAVIGFHCLTALLFPIGLFPWIMIAGSLIFIQDNEWKRLFNLNHSYEQFTTTVPKWIYPVFLLHFGIQIALPLRHFFYSENQLWTERHYRFGWNVMLAEKTGAVIFTLEDAQHKKWIEYPNTKLNAIQEKQMAFQADMIWQYAQHLAHLYQSRGIDIKAIHADCKVSFNGRPSQLYLPDTLNLLDVNQDNIYDYVLPIADPD